MTGVIAGAALGALMVMMMAPDSRQPIMDGAGRLGNRMRKMWKQGGEQVQEMMPTDGGH